MQEVIVIIIVGVAALYCMKQFIKNVKNKTTGNCRCAFSCDSKEPRYKNIIK